MRAPAPSAALDALFTPRSIAVVGASNKPGKMGNLFMERLARGFGGRLYAVNPAEREIAGLPTHASIGALPDEVDLLIALVPAASLVSAIEECRPGQVRYVLAVPSGFGEVSAQGRALQKQLATAASARGTRLLGPNIVGIMNAAIGLNASMMPFLPPGGPGLSCLTQSGGFGMALSMYAVDHGVKVAKFCDLGNTADLDVHEVLRYYADDPDTTVIGLFLESVLVRDAFLTAAAQAARRKPVVFAPIGVTEVGRRASFGHLGIQSGVADLLDQLPAGIIRAETGLDLLNAVKALLWQRSAEGRRIAILTGTGGIGAELADLATLHGLSVPEFSPALRERIGRHLPYYAGMLNPVDVTPVWAEYPMIYPNVLAEVAASGEVDLAIVSVTDVATTLTDLAAALAEWSRASPIPAVAYWGAQRTGHGNMDVIQAAGLPCFPSAREAVSAAAALCPR